MQDRYACLDAVGSRLEEVEALMGRLALGEAGDCLGGMVGEHLGTGGKRLRARLALASAGVLAPHLDDASVAWAAACEMAHNATLVHDDLQDGDEQRRGRPTVWVRHGAAQAINAGDMMFMLAFLAVAQIKTDAPGEDEANQRVRATLSQILATRVTATIRGQAAEYDMMRCGHVDRDTYLRAIAGKTSGLFQLPVEGAAVLARVDPHAALGMAAPFEQLGVLFQLQDDVLDLYGEKGRQNPGSDLREGKISALVVEHLARHPGDQAWLLDLLRRPRDETPAALVEEAISRFRTGGALDAVLRRVRETEEAILAGAQRAADGKLLDVAREIVALCLKPIAHLF